MRHIDTAWYYGCEERLGAALRDSGVPRSALWITNKLWTADYGHAAAKQACLDSCSRMGLDYFGTSLFIYLLKKPVHFLGFIFDVWENFRMLSEGL